MSMLFAYDDLNPIILCFFSTFFFYPFVFDVDVEVGVMSIILLVRVIDEDLDRLLDRIVKQ